MYVRAVTNDVAVIMFYVRWGVHGGDYSKTAVSVVNFVMWVSLNHMPKKMLQRIRNVFQVT
jgi:hypothetical protein